MSLVLQLLDWDAHQKHDPHSKKCMFLTIPFFPRVDPGLTFGERYSLDLVRNIAACMMDMIAYRIHLINSIGRCVVQHCGSNLR